MLKLELDVYTMFDVYAKEVRSVLEIAVPVWHSGLTKQQSADIERIQKLSFKLILGGNYANYKQACEYLSTQTLEQRRTKLCLKFASKNIKSDKCLFTKIVPRVNTRRRSNIVKEYKCRTGRYRKSSLPFLASLVNTNNRKKKK